MVVGGCGWLWVVVVDCGWLWVVVGGCGWLWGIYVDSYTHIEHSMADREVAGRPFDISFLDLKALRQARFKSRTRLSGVSMVFKLSWLVC